MRLLARSLGVFVALLALVVQYASAASILISDTRDAFDQVQALKTVLQEVDQRIQAIQKQYESEVAPLSTELEKLRQAAGENQQRKAQILLQIAQLQKQTALRQQAVGKANEKAFAQIDAMVAKIEQELKTEKRADAVLRAQDTLYFNAQCSCNITQEIYRRLNQRLPKVTLEIAP